MGRAPPLMTVIKTPLGEGALGDACQDQRQGVRRPNHSRQTPFDILPKLLPVIHSELVSDWLKWSRFSIFFQTTLQQIPLWL